MPDAAEKVEVVLVVDDDERFRAFVRTLVERAGWLAVEAADGAAALESAARSRPDVVVLDVCLPRASGYEVVRELRERYADEVAILFASGERVEPIDRVSGLLLGADDYLVKPFDPDELLARIRTVLRRTQRTRRDPVGNRLGEASEAELTPRELEVLRLLADGLTQPEIAARLVISPRTVGTHIQNLLGKLGVHSRAQAVAYVHRQGLTVGV